MRTAWVTKGMLALAALATGMTGSESPTWSFVSTAQAAEAGVCSNTMAKNRKRCRIDVKVVDSGTDSCEITFAVPAQKELVLDGQSNIRIVWRLNDGNGDYLFCRQTGDGVFLKKPARQQDGQVLTMRVMKTQDSDDNDTEDEFNCSPRFRWTFKNEVDAVELPPVEYSYFILVRNKAFTRTCKSPDPFIKNG